MEAPNTDKISREDLVARARGLIPLVRDHADQAERDRMVSTTVMEALRDSGIFRTLQPERFGGFEYDFGMIIRIACEIGQGCASTAWVCDLAMMHQWLVANFPIEAQEEVWDDPNAITFGSYSPVAAAEPADGGWRISGSWPFASGCDHGQWALLGVRFPPSDDGGRAVAGFTLVPAGDYGIDDDWDTSGLAATGSKRIVCDDVFVPSHRRLDIEDAKSGTSAGFKALGKALYGIPMFAVIPTAITGPALGALQGAIDEFIEQTKVRKTIAMAAAQPMAGF